ncbi:MAG TPA: SIMPL domain-containing protein [Phototrophicaceae bacterium]|jgi:hypothetical protein|nr:SIMPL domain-containing protein [Phototrophicaceae bacterium]
MKFSGKILAIAGVGALVAALAVMALPALAQTATGGSGASYPLNTITVVGSGVAYGAPDMATVEVGVNVVNASVTEAFTEANTKAKAIVDALVALGIAPEDIATTNLSVYTVTDDTGLTVTGYNVSNSVRVTVRDVAKAGDVIDAAIQAGANTLNNLSFDIADHSALESQAREKALGDAKVRAEEYAKLIGATLGDVIVVTENTVGGAIPMAAYDMKASGGAFVTAGQTEVSIQTQVTYQIVR